MIAIVLGGGMVGVTTDHYLLEDGHEVTQIERQPGVARESSHASGGFVAIGQAVTWSAGACRPKPSRPWRSPTRRS